MSDKKGNETYSIDNLVDVMRALRNPDGGCPWDLEQDFKSILPHTLEEAYEVADAIDKDDMINLREELGDLLFQSIYHAQMADEAGHFNFDDVVHDITAKMIYRHPHVFGDANANSAADVNAIWDQRKEAKDQAKSSALASALEGVPHALPALLRAQKLQKKAAKTGFEWTKAEDILDKLEEELAEMREAVRQGTMEQKADELGDILFVIANLGRILDINAEEALRQCNAKFEKRFKGMEEDAKLKNQKFSDLSLDEMTRLWINQKQKERRKS
ncbi:MAG: nucleoside triphosphate pyrophosphohydrolase [Micavibrio sp.]|nr:nucleoside triphosphate pyrophosphohydrolase [Micavibrio sp.]